MGAKVGFALRGKVHGKVQRIISEKLDTRKHKPRISDFRRCRVATAIMWGGLVDHGKILSRPLNYLMDRVGAGAYGQYCVVIPAIRPGHCSQKSTSDIQNMSVVRKFGILFELHSRCQTPGKPIEPFPPVSQTLLRLFLIAVDNVDPCQIVMPRRFEAGSRSRSEDIGMPAFTVLETACGDAQVTQSHL